MKKIIVFLFFISAFASGNFAQSKSEFVEVLYFHRTTRCNTCQSIERVTSELLNKEYKKELQSGTIVFQSIDYQQDTNNVSVKKYTIEGPTLLVITHSKKKDHAIDLTDLAFDNAVSSPGILKKELTERIDGFFR